jgi:hypothetical protein
MNTGEEFGHNSHNSIAKHLIVSIYADKHLPHCPAIVAIYETSQRTQMMTKKHRWLSAAIEAAMTEAVIMPWQNGSKGRPITFKHIQIQVAPRPQSAAAR